MTVAEGNYRWSSLLRSAMQRFTGRCQRPSAGGAGAHSGWYDTGVPIHLERLQDELLRLSRRLTSESSS